MAEHSSHLPMARLADFEPISPEIISLLPAGLAKKQMIVPLKMVKGSLLVAVPKTEGVVKPEGLALVVGCPVEFVLASVDEIIACVKRYYSAETPTKSLFLPPENYGDSVEIDAETAALLDLDLSVSSFEASLEKSGSKTPAPKETSNENEMASQSDQSEQVLEVASPPGGGVSAELLKLVTEAVITRASEVLINLKKEKVQIRQRLRGIYIPIEPSKQGLTQQEVGRLLEWLKQVGEKESSGGIEWTEYGKELKIADELFSVHLFLTDSKDSKVLTVRLRSQRESVFSPSTWGMDPAQIKIFNEFLERKQGLLLFAGSQGIGLTRTLHACAKHLATPKKHVMAVESTMETWLSGIDSYYSQGDRKLFLQLLQGAFKHAPDVVLANPLEQKDQFETCLSEALKGRLILGRSFAVDCADALVQLVGMGVEPYLVGSALMGVTSKRTLRLNCPVCQVKDPTARSQARELGIAEAMQPTSFFVSQGCESCHQTGFNGEIDIFEILVMSPEMRNIFNKDVRVETIRPQIKSSGLLTLRQVALHKAINGQTSLAEVVRTTPK